MRSSKFAALLLLLALVFGASPAFAQVTFDAKPTGGTAGWSRTASAATLTITTLTVGSCSNRAIALAIFTGTQGVSFPSGLAITRNTGETFTQITGTLFADSALTSVGAWYGLLNPSAGNVTITASWTGNNEMHMIAFSFCGVDQTSVAVAFPNGTAATPATGTTATVTVTSATNDKTVAMFSQNIGNWTATNGQITNAIDNNGPNLGVAADYQNGAATVAMTGTIGSSGRWNAMGTDIKAAAAGGTTPNLRSLLGVGK